MQDLHSQIETRTAAEIDAQVQALVREQVERNLTSREALAQLAALYARMYEAFEAKPVGTTLCGFQRFDEWGTARMGPLHESMQVGRSQAFYYAKIGRVLLPALGEEKVVTLGIEKCKALARYAQAKNQLPEEFVELAANPETTAEYLHAEVRRRLFQGNPDHAPGPRREYMVTGGESEVIDLMEDLNFARQVEFSDGPSDAEILHLTFQAYRQERENSAAQEAATLAGFNGVKQAALYRLIEYTASLKAKVTMRKDFSVFAIELRHAIMLDLCNEFGIPWECVSPIPAGRKNEEA